METPQRKSSLPPQFERLIRVIYRNKLLQVDETTMARGKSMDNPIVIDFTEDYVELEYMVIEYLLHGKQHSLVEQRLRHENDRHLDMLQFDITDEGGSVRRVDIWFDITAGFEALKKG